jgi:predicted component of type VI protein secretion system
MKFTCRHKDAVRTYVTQSTDVTVGRSGKSATAAVRIEGDSSISRRQMRVWTSDGEIWVEDTLSTWGTRVNGAAIEEATKVTARDRIQIGDTIVIVSLDDDGEPADVVEESNENIQSLTLLPGYLQPDE